MRTRRPPGFSTRAHSRKTMRRTFGGNSWNKKMLEHISAELNLGFSILLE
jgi:hypothetical protein